MNKIYSFNANLTVIKMSNQTETNGFLQAVDVEEHLKKLAALGIIADCAQIVCQDQQTLGSDYAKSVRKWADDTCAVSCNDVKRAAYEYWKANKVGVSPSSTATSVVERQYSNGILDYYDFIMKEKDAKVFKELLLRLTTELRPVDGFAEGKLIDISEKLQEMVKTNPTDGDAVERFAFIVTNRQLGYLFAVDDVLAVLRATEATAANMAIISSIMQQLSPASIASVVQMIQFWNLTWRKPLLDLIVQIFRNNLQTNVIVSALEKVKSDALNSGDAELAQYIEQTESRLPNYKATLQTVPPVALDGTEASVSFNTTSNAGFRDELQKLNVLFNAETSNVAKTTSFEGSELNEYASLLYLLKKYKSTCSPIAIEDIYGSIIQWRCAFIKKKCKRFLSVSPNFYRVFKQCLANNNVRFVIGLIRLENKTGEKDNTDAHANAYIYDRRDNSMEIFEPNGYIESNIEKWFDADEFYTQLEQQFRRNLPIREFHRPGDFCPRISFQYAQSIEQGARVVSDPGGFCAAWSLWWLEFRLQNAESSLSRSDLVKAALKLLEEKKQAFAITLTEYIRNYANDIVKYRNQLLSSIYKNLEQSDEGKRIINQLENKTALTERANLVKTVSDHQVAQLITEIALDKSRIRILQKTDPANVPALSKTINEKERSLVLQRQQLAVQRQREKTASESMEHALQRYVVEAIRRQLATRQQ